MAQQTAVQFLEPLLIEKIHALSLKRRHEIISLIQQAKQMEKDQHDNTWVDSRIEYNGDDYIGKEKTFEQYYNETYGKQ